MNAARRSARRKNWPLHLYEPRPGYYVFRGPDGKTLALGAIPLAHAIHQVMQANAYLLAQAPSLVDRLSGQTNTIADVLDKMPKAVAVNTIKAQKSQDGMIRAALGSRTCLELTVAHCAEFISAKASEGKMRSAQALRSRLIEVCRTARELGWMSDNPAEVTRNPKAIVKRGRLTLESFRAIYAQAPSVAPWLQRAMMLGLVLGADRLTISGLTRSHVANGLLTYQRQKTGAWIAVPLALRMDAVGVSLRDLVDERGPVLSPYLLHHTRSQGQASAGDAIHPDTMSDAFTQARKLAGIADAGAPTYHELRSLCKRTYEDQGGVDTKALLGHAGERVSELYADARGVEPVRVKLG